MNNLNYEKQYFELFVELMECGRWVENERTGERCLTTIGHTMHYNSGAGHVPLLSSKQSFPVSAVAEIIGYLRGYTDAQKFADIGSPTWFKNANETQAWLDNIYRKGENDMGQVYGAVARNFNGVDLVEKVYNNLKNGKDDRGETITFWKPDQFDQGCLRPCMRNHTFSILGDTLYLTSESRSVDVALGLNFNSIQCDFLLKLMAQITGLKVGYVIHNMINVHIYEKHLPALQKQMSLPIRELKECSLKIKPNIKTLEDVIGNDLHAREYVDIQYSGHSGKVHFEMTA